MIGGINVALTPKKRKEMESLIYSTFTALDPSGTNTEKYKSLFSKMSDAQFDKFFKELFKNPNRYLILDIVDYEHSISMENIENAAKVLNVPLMRRLLCRLQTVIRHTHQ